ncbi:MAG: hypothetical protein ACE5FU_14695 [Nitrospinota bacterium]
MMKPKKYDLEIEAGVQLFASTLNERGLRRYFAVEALTSGHGGIAYISELRNINPKTVSRGLEEIEIKALDTACIRRHGAGHSYLEKTCPDLHEIFLDIVSKHPLAAL